MHSAKKTNQFVLSCSRFFVTLASPKFLALGIKNKPVCFVLLSFFRNFAVKLMVLQEYEDVEEHNPWIGGCGNNRCLR